MPARAWYQPKGDPHHDDGLHIVEFYGDPAFDLPDWAAGQEQHWFMFTHGIYAVVAGRRLLFHRIAVTNYHLAEASEDTLAERLGHAARILRLMEEDTDGLGTGSACSGQCLQAAETLEREQGRLVEDLLSSYRLAKEAERV